MEKKTVRELGRFTKWRKSISVKSAVLVVLCALFVGLTILGAGFTLYVSGTSFMYRVSTYNMAKAEAAMLDSEKVHTKTKQIIDIYDSIPEAQRGDGTGAAYLKRFEPVNDETLQNIREEMQSAREKIGLRNAFIVAIDTSANRMIYLIDSDPHPESVCPPGSWDIYRSEDIDALVNGMKLLRTQRISYSMDTPHAVITELPKYGRRCTAGAELYKTDRYTVMICLDETLEYPRAVSMLFLRLYMALLLIVMAIVTVAVLVLIRRSLVLNIRRLADSALAYTEDQQEGKRTPNHFAELDIHSGDELEELKLTMEDMEDSLTRYVRDLTAATAERERLNTELDLAARIQASMLPRTFPAFPEREEFDLYASMDPARQVGGDFYDYFLIDDDHLALVIADVSGKGIPAALFMMVSMILLKNKTMEIGAPARTLEEMNNMISKENQEEMFVTIWLGILEISTGRLSAANAGHEYPVIISPRGDAELYHDKHGFVIGGMEGMKYREYELQMEPGSKLFLYTDGVAEASTKENELFGTDRMLEALQTDAKAGPQQILKNMHEALDRFAGDAEQFDDITMLCLEYRGAGNPSEES